MSSTRVKITGTFSCLQTIFKFYILEDIYFKLSKLHLFILGNMNSFTNKQVYNIYMRVGSMGELSFRDVEILGRSGWWKQLQAWSPEKEAQ